MNFLFARTLGMYVVYFKFLTKGEKKSLREIWNKRDEYNLALYGFCFWLFLIIISFCIVVYCAKNNLSI